MILILFLFLTTKKLQRIISSTRSYVWYIYLCSLSGVIICIYIYNLAQCKVIRSEGNILRASSISHPSTNCDWSERPIQERARKTSFTRYLIRLSWELRAWRQNTHIVARLKVLLRVTFLPCF